MNGQNFKPLIGPVLILAFLTLTTFAVRPLTPIDETRYASVAWEMWLRDEYLVMFKNGEPYSHKPPLLFWLYNMGWTVFGVNEWWPRLVSPLFSLGGLFLTLSIARRLWPDDENAGRNALWVLGSSMLWLVFSTIAMFDVMLAFFVLTGMRGLLIAANESMKRGFAWLALAIGLGVLAKGPVILLHLLPAALLAPWWQQSSNLAGQNWKHWYGAILLAVLGGAAIALAWAIPAAIHGGEEYRNAIFWGQTANRMVDSFAHKRPFWWYLPLLPVLLFPWLVWPGLWSRFMSLKRNGMDAGLRFCVAWAAPVFVSFSLISGKQLHYLVPLVPAFALFSARLLTNLPRGGILFPALLSGLLGGVLIYLAIAGLPGKYSDWANPPVWPGLVLSIYALILILGNRDRNWHLPSLALLGALSFVMLQIGVFSSLGPIYDVHPISREIRKLQDEGRPVANAGGYHAQFQFMGRLEKPLEQLDKNELQPWLDNHPAGAVVMYLKKKNVRFDALFSQAYRGGMVMLMDVAQTKAYLAEQKAGENEIRTQPEADEP